VRADSCSVGTRTIAALAAAAALAVGAASAPPADAKPLKGPSGLAFYKPPKLPKKGHGTLLWARKAKGLVPLADASYTKLVLYSSRSPQGKRIAVSGSVSVPEGDPPKGGWPLISYAHGTTGSADACAPSRNAVGGPAQPYTSYVDPELNAWLRAGYAVARSDYQGLGTPGKHPYLVGESEGRGVLDIVKAARGLDPGIGRRFLIAGHSQGGHAALFAAGLAETWTPGLKLRGTIAYAPASHLLEQTSLLPALTSPNPLSALATMILAGAATQSAQIDVPALLSDPALNFYPLLESVCLQQLSDSSSLGGIAPSALLRSGADTTALFAQLERMNPAVRTSAPVLIAQGQADTTVFEVFTNQLRDELLAQGNSLTYSKYPGVDHGSIVSAASAEALAFFEQHLPGGN
jgi:alpha-beta hydrolase superfamily lysophospholipase